MRLTRTAVAVALVTALSVAGATACSGDSSEDNDEQPTYTQVELEARATYLAELALGLGLEDPPAVKLIRFVGREEWAATQISCLSDAGFPVKLLGDGEGIDATPVPESQRQPGGPFNVATYECEAKFTSTGASTGSLSDAQLGRLYDWYVSVSMPCIASEGIDVESPPSKQTFIETYFTNDGWFPYGSVGADTMPIGDWNALNNACPQSPPDEVLGL